MEEVQVGKTDKTITVFIPDPASTTLQGKTGLAHSAITVSYTRVETDNDVVNTDVTSSLNALSTLLDAHNDWGWIEVSSSLSPGLYRLDLADALFADGADEVVLNIMITSGTAAVTPIKFKLVKKPILYGTASATGATTTNVPIKTIDVTPSATNQLKGRVIIFLNSTPTSALRGQGAPIDGNSGSAITIAAGNALTNAPAEDEQFIIV